MVPEPVPEPQPAAILVEQEIVMVEAQPRKITSFFDEIGSPVVLRLKVLSSTPFMVCTRMSVNPVTGLR